MRLIEVLLKQNEQNAAAAESESESNQFVLDSYEKAVSDKRLSILRTTKFRQIKQI